MNDIAKRTAKLRQKAFKERQGPIKEQKYIGSNVWESMIVGKGSYMGSRWDKVNIIEQAYQRNAPYYAAANMIATMVAGLPFEVETNVRGKRSRTDNHPLISALGRNEPIRDYLKKKVLYYIVTGETFSEIVMANDKSRPVGYICLPSQFVKKIEGNRYNPILEYRYMEKGTEVTIDKNNIIHIFNPSLSNYFEELSPAIPLQELISLNNSAISWNKNVAQAGGLPPIVAKAMGINEKQAQEIQKGWANQSGANNSHLLKIVSQNLEFEKMNDSPHDAEWQQAVVSSMRMIFMVLGTSSSLMNDAANKTYNNYHEARKSMYMENVIPLAELFMDAITRKVNQYYRDNPKLVIAKEKIEAIQEERKEMIDRLVKAVQGGIMTENEARKDLGLPKGKGPTADMLQRTGIINNIPKVETNNQEVENELDQPEQQNPNEDENKS